MDGTAFLDEYSRKVHTFSCNLKNGPGTVMVLSVLVFVTLAVGIHEAAGHHINDAVYQKMCDKTVNFSEGLIKCFEEMPDKDQRILKFCGSVFGNGTIDDFVVLVDDTCKDEHYAIKVVKCMHRVTHVLYHIDDSPHYRHDDHPHDDDGHHDGDGHHEEHDDHQFDFGHGVYNEECFKSLYESFDIVPGKEDQSKKDQSKEDQSKEDQSKRTKTSKVQ